MMTSYIIAMLYPGSRGETTGNTRYAKSKFFIAKYFAQNAGRQTCSDGAVTTAVTFLLHVPSTRHSCLTLPEGPTLLPTTPRRTITCDVDWDPTTAHSLF